MYYQVIVLEMFHIIVSVKSPVTFKVKLLMFACCAEMLDWLFNTTKHKRQNTKKLVILDAVCQFAQTSSQQLKWGPRLLDYLWPSRFFLTQIITKC